MEMGESVLAAGTSEPIRTMCTEWYTGEIDGLSQAGWRLAYDGMSRGLMRLSGSYKHIKLQS